MSDIYKILESLSKIDPTPKKEEVYVPVKSKLEKTMIRLQHVNESVHDWLDLDLEPNGQLIQNVANRVMRYIQREHPEADMQVAYERALENAYYLVHDWPEGEGFGSSDSYGAIQNTLKDLGLKEDYSIDEPDDDAMNFAEPMDMDSFGSEVDYDSLEDPDDPRQDSIANRRFRKDRDLKSRGQYAQVESEDAESMDTDEFDILDQMGMFPADDEDDDYATQLDREQYDDEDFGVEEDAGMIKRGLKKMKRGWNAWDKDDKVKDVVKGVQDLEDEWLMALAGDERALKGSPADLQRKVANRELKKRYGLTPKGNIKDKNVGEAEGDKMATYRGLKGLDLYTVYIKNNYYNGKTADYSARPYMVVASSEEEAKQVVLNNADAILKELLAKKFPGGKRVLPPRSALPITDREIGQVKQGGRGMTTSSKTLYTPTGKQTFRLENGKIVDGEVDEAVQQFTQHGKTYVTGGEEGDEVVKAFDDPAKAQKFKQANQLELNKPEPDPENILQVADSDEEEQMQESQQEMVESDVIYNPGDTVRVSDNLSDRIGKKYRGKRGKVAFTQGGSVYVKLGRGSEVEFRPTELIKEGFGDYDDFEVTVEADPTAMSAGEDVNPDMVEFDPENPEHRERLQRGTRVILTPVLFSEPGTDRGGILTDLSKTGFFCKVVRNADGKTINVHMSDIEYADLFNNTVYEDYQKQFNDLLEDITVTRTENPESPELDTMTITGTEDSVDELAQMLQAAGLSARSEQPAMDAEPEMVSEPADMEIVTDGEEELLAQMRREIHGEEEGIEEELSNEPDPRVAPVAAALAGGGLNKRKRQYRDEYPGDNPMAVRKTRNIEETLGKDLIEEVLDRYAEEKGLAWLRAWAEGETLNDDELTDELLEINSMWDDGSGRASEDIWNQYKEEVMGYVEWKEAEANDMGESQINEKAAPGQEDWIKSNKQRFIDQYGKDKGLEVLYATAWKRHNNESIEESSMSEFDIILSHYDPRELLAWAKGDSDAAPGLDDALLDADGDWDTGSGRAYEEVWNQYKDEIAAYAQEKMQMGESKRPGAALDEVDSFLNLYKAFSERGEKR